MKVLPNRSSPSLSGASFRIQPATVVPPLNEENILKHLSSRHQSAKEEISESKQLLFNKHLGLDSGGLEGGEDLQQQLSSCTAQEVTDCGVSSNYPNSSFSTSLRENTFSSFSSMIIAAAAGNQMAQEAALCPSEDPESGMSSSVKEVDDSPDVKVAASHEAEQTINEDKDQPEQADRKRPLKAWGQTNISSVERKFMLQQKRMQEYFRHKDTDRWQASLSTETDMSSICNQLKEDGEEQQQPNISKPPTPNKFVRKEKSPEKLVKSEIAKELEPKKLVIPMQEVLRRPAPRPATAPIFKRPSFVRDKESVASSVQSHVSGVYTNEYLTRARKFGAVVGALRKPGHHIGPAKNPDCICEHCTRWFEEKCRGRGRANSITNTPLTFEGFRARRLQQ